MFWGVEVGKAEGILIIFIVNMSRRRHHLSIVYHKAFIHHNINVKLSSSHSKEWTTHYTATDSVQSFCKVDELYTDPLQQIQILDIESRRKRSVSIEWISFLT